MYTYFLFFLRVFLRDDALRRGIRGDRGGGLRGPGAEIPPDVPGHEEIAETVLLLRALHSGVGDPVRRIFREYRGYRIRKVFRDGGDCARALVHPAQ